ncbi:MAG: helix-turn-helix transcriptional regulator [Clostridia bacterium]|nr:helix-turn-helix transcriptional regulator [Clostridia bacterium]
MIVTNPSIFNKEIDHLHLNISDLCYAQLDKGDSYSDPRPLFTRVYCIKKGEGKIVYRGGEMPMTEGNIYILPTGLRMRYKCNTPLEKLYFHINLLQSNNKDMFTTMNTPVCIPNRSEDIEQALYLFNNNDMYAVMRLKAWLWDIISIGMEIGGTEFTPVPKYSPLVEQTIAYIDRNLKSALTVSSIAADLYTSQSRLQKEFRKEMGQPLGKYISDRLFFVAEQRLRTTDLAIKDISTELGYCDPFYFTRCFTQRYGVSPSEYRKQYKN